MGSKSSFRCVCLLLVLFAFCGWCLAGEVDPAQAFPPDTIAYLSYDGSSALRDAYLKTALGQIMQMPQMQAFGGKLYQNLLAVARSEAEKRNVDIAPAEQFRVRRIAIGFIGLSDPAMGEVPIQQGAPVDIAALLETEQGLAPLVKLIRDQVAKDQPNIQFKDLTYKGLPYTSFMAGPVQVYWTVVGNRLVVATSAQRAAKLIAALAEPPADSLATSANFRKCLAAVGPNASALLHIDATVLLTKMGPFLPPQVMQTVESLGLTGIRSLSFGRAYAGEGVRGTIFINAPEPRKGIVSVLGGGPAEPPKALDLIPADVAFGYAGSLKPDEQFTRIDEMVALVSLPALDALDNVVMRIDMALGFGLRQDLLPAFGPGLAIWITNNGTPIVAIELADAAKFDACIQKLKANPNLRFAATAVGDKAIEYVSAPGVPMPLAPCYVRHGKYLLVSAAPHMLRDALDRVNDKAPLLKDDPGFKRATVALPANAASIAYADTSAGTMMLYNWGVMLLNIVNGLPNRGPLPDIPLAELPSAYAISKYLFPSAYARTVNADGICYQSFSPAGIMPAGAPGVAVLAGLLLPALTSARGQARRVACSNNLRQIGMGCMTYVDGKGGGRNYPKKLEDLLKEGVVEDLRVFICPRSGDRPAPDRFVCSYESIFDLTQKQLTNELPPDTMIVWDKPGHHGNRRNVLFADAHVEVLDEATFQQRLVKLGEILEKLGQPK